MPGSLVARRILVGLICSLAGLFSSLDGLFRGLGGLTIGPVGGVETLFDILNRRACAAAVAFCVRGCGKKGKENGPEEAR